MGQCAAGYIIHAQLRDSPDIFFCHVAGALGFGPAVNYAYGFSHLFRSHVIQHDNVGTGIHCLLHHVKVLCLYLNLTDKGSVCLCSGNRLPDASGCVNVVIL